MIDLGLTKLAVIGAVALVVIGPEKLPTVARALGKLYGRAQRYISQVKSEVSREMELDELRKMQQEVQSAAQDVGQTISEHVQQAEQEVGSIWNEPASYSDWKPVPSVEQVTAKAKDFRRKKLQRSSALPAWYKNRHGNKQKVMSGAARVARHRPRSTPSRSFYG